MSAPFAKSTVRATRNIVALLIIELLAPRPLRRPHHLLDLALFLPLVLIACTEEVLIHLAEFVILLPQGLPPPSKTLTMMT